MSRAGGTPAVRPGRTSMSSEAVNTGSTRNPGRTKGVPSMELSPSAHTDTFCRDNLPPASQWPELRLDLAGLSYPDRLNCAEALLDDVVARFGPFFFNDPTTTE